MGRLLPLFLVGLVLRPQIVGIGPLQVDALCLLAVVTLLTPRRLRGA